MLVHLDTDQSPDVAHCGGKAAGLIELARAGLPVMPGFCIPSPYYRAHLEECSRRDSSIDREARRRAITSHPLAANLLEEIQTQLGWLKSEGHEAWAIRSSASQEDGSRTSFAGLHDTVLNVVDLDGCETAVKQCWASLWSERAHAYRDRNGIAHDDCGMAVVIQAMVPASASGVAFTIDPVTRNPKFVTIEAVSGLGELLVSGRVEPDRYVIDREQLTVEGFTPGSRSTELVARPGGGTEERSARDGHAIPESVAIAIARHVAAFVEQCGGERDIEWATSGGQLYFVQSRPITTPALSAEEQLEGQVWSNVNSGEVMPDVVTPMSWSLLQAVERMLKGIARIAGVDVGPHPLVGRICGRIYFNLNTVVGAIRRIPFAKNIDPYRALGGLTVGDRDPLDIPDEYIPTVSASGLSILTAIPRVLVWAVQCRPSMAGPKLAEVVQQRKDPAWYRLPSLTDDELIERIDRTYRELFADPAMLGIPMVGMAYFDGLERVCARWFTDDPGLFGRLLSGQGGVESAESGLELLRLARFVDQSPLRDTILAVTQYKQLTTALESTPEANAWWQRWQSFLDTHGHHTRGEIELANPRWSEQPDEVFVMLKAYVRSFDERDLLEEYRERARDSQRAFDEASARLWWPKRLLFRYLVRGARRGASARENIKSEVIRHVALVRAVLLELGRRSLARGQFSSADDIFFLTLDELHELPASKSSAWRDIVHGRRKEYEWNCQTTPPPVVYGFGQQPQAEDYAEAENGEMSGLAVSPGIVRGPARVVLRTADEPELLPGEILVAPFTDPGWTPLMIPAAAIVTDMGGLLSHGSIVARELGIPAVANVGHATECFATGDLLEVDGTHGIVRRAVEGK